jgi:hypothetical protein
MTQISIVRIGSSVALLLLTGERPESTQTRHAVRGAASAYGRQADG